jgi:hypothetical protein
MLMIILAMMQLRVLHLKMCVERRKRANEKAIKSECK